jgi:hypothetical protein
MSVKRALTSLLALGVGLLLTFAPAAGATETKPFEITKFTMQTTRAKAVPAGIQGKGNIDEFSGSVNEPYSFTQAGGHPDAITTSIEFSTELIEHEANPHGGLGAGTALMPTRDPKDIVADLPPGLLADPQAVPRCPLSQVTSNSAVSDPCPSSTQVGVVVLRLFGGIEYLGPIVNLTPEAGQSAEFGLENDSGLTYVITGHVVRIGSTYGLTATTNEIPLTELSGVELTFWGVPAAASHDPQRGLFCGKNAYLPEKAFDSCSGGGESTGVSAVPFWTMGSDCAAGAETATLRADSWEEPGSVREGKYTGYVERTDGFPGVTGCNLLGFDPSVEVSPDVLGADEPVGLGVGLSVPQDQEPAASGTPQLRNLDVTLPEGLSISPGIVDGIQACNESGPEGINFEGPESEKVGLNGELQLAPGHCPDASIVGSAKAFSPLLNEPLEGHVYLARPGCGGPGQRECTPEDAADGSLYQLYLELGGKGALGDAGVNLKVRLKTEANPATGQLTTVAENNPQLPFSRLEVDLNGGPRAPLDNPAVCGEAVTTSDWTPWSAPGVTPEGLLMAGTADATPSSFYDVTGCADPPGLNPGFTAGTVTPQAGQFSAFTLNLSRQDREQFVKGLQVHTPPGLLGMLSSVPLCGAGEAEAGTCGEASKIGTTRVASGAGSHPFEIEGSVYLTGPYDGAPFGLSIVTHAVAGPFNLGLVIVRARIAVDPETSALTITTDETGPHAIPQILDGVPLRLQRVTVDIDRPGFMFNPTSCAGQQITAVVSGSEDARAEVSSPFAVGGCKSLAFKPMFAVSTSGRTSRADGASLDAKLSYPAGSVGSEANIARVKVELPKQLPSQLKTLQKACPAATFASDPADCPAPSIVGIARASTPLLPVGLQGPVYFVSHGGEAFPSLEIVLQGDGVRVDLTGSTFISKTGITSSTFKTVPDVPVSSFELYLPEGPYSALAANGNLCKTAGKLKMPTELVAQNGAVIHETTKIAVTGCTKPKKAKASKRTRAKRASDQRRADS